jgi:hypothetical protein
MNDDQLSLAFSMHARPGVYALLLGSGISRAAQIPTGWEVVEDLVRKVAVASQQTCTEPPDAWFRSTYGEEPNYSRLLERVAPRPADRRELLRSYFEPTQQQRAEGIKMPTRAHRAIAKLMRAGYIRVVLTTNFDRLLELALEDEGVRPDIIDTADKAKGARPLVHSPATIIKLHGDYGDERIKNTPEELATYEPEMNQLVDRVLADYGLVLCGWSGDYDDALCAAIARCQDRRYSTYWGAFRGTLSEKARRLLEHRDGVVLSIDSADAFFTGLQEQVDALARYAQRSPISSRVAVAMLERYLVSDEHRIQLQRLVDGEVERAFAAAKETAALLTQAMEPTILEERGEAMLAATDTLLHLVVTGCYWGEARHDAVWVRVLKRLMEPLSGSGFTGWLAYARYPAQLVFYAGGLACLEKERLTTATHLFHQAKVRLGSGKEEAPFAVLNSALVREAMYLPKGRHPDARLRWAWPASEGLFAVLRPYFRELVPSDGDFERLFDRFECILTLAVATQPGAPVIPARATVRSDHGASVLVELLEQLDKFHNNWPPLMSGLIPSTAQTLKELARAVDAQLQQLSFQMRVR